MDTREKKPAARRASPKSTGKKGTRPSSRRSTTGTNRPVRRSVSRSRRAESQVVYTPPKAFSRYRLLLGLLTAAAVVLAMTLGMSIFFKVENVTVSGMEKYTAWDVREASGIQEGDNLLTLGKARVGGKIIARLPYVDTVRVGIKLPDTVNIEITELDVVYAIQSTDNSWWVLNADGKVLEKISGIAADNHTKIVGVWITDPVVGQPAVASAAVEAVVPSETTAEGETEQTAAPEAPDETVKPTEQLAAALTIIACMEENGIIGEATSVDVTHLYDLQLWYDGRYQVILGEGTQLTFKIRAMKQAIAQMMDYQEGILDVSFTTWPDKVGYTPFEE